VFHRHEARRARAHPVCPSVSAAFAGGGGAGGEWRQAKRNATRQEKEKKGGRKTRRWMDDGGSDARSEPSEPLWREKCEALAGRL
jgi:hypothetical protein